MSDRDDDLDVHYGRILRCAIEQNISFHRFKLAPDSDRYMFDSVSAPTLEEAHRLGCKQCEEA